METNVLLIMPSLSKKEIDEFLSRPLLAKIATLLEDGSPYVNPVWFLWEDSALLLGGRKGFGGVSAKWVENLERDARVAILIDTEEYPYTRVLMTGTAEIQDPPPSNWQETDTRLTVKYVGEEEARRYTSTLPTLPGARIRIRPEKISSWRGSEWHPRYLKPKHEKKSD
jgi:nitroimidazol reductase NimA-like FMN-containing flavoprotein (pyridoxamine 5'-phosphate oxidase superfamily)